MAVVSRFIRRIWYLGFRHYCPFCHSHLRSFVHRGLSLPIFQEAGVLGAGGQWNCPVCQSYDRERLLFLYLSRETTVFKSPTRFLHIAPEQELSKKLRSTRTIDYVSGDLEPVTADMKIDVQEIPFPDNAFDALICSHVLEHVDDDHKAMSELFRVLNDDGWAILQVPIAMNRQKTDEDPSITDPKERERRFGQNDHVRLYGTDYFERLSSIGFNVEIRDYISELGSDEKEKYGLFTEEKLIICSRASANRTE
jgi:SAM-dependent methyltransferase